MNPHLIVFLTRGISLKIREEIGTLDRETALYQRLQKAGWKVSLVTYGGREDLAYRDRFPGIEICCNYFHLPRRMYARFLPYLHAGALRQCTIVRTNQSTGADAALRAARWWNKPYVARCGFMWSEFEERQFGTNSHQAAQAHQVEEMTFRAAARVVVTTPRMAANVRSRFPDTANRIRIIPNFVDTELFAPQLQSNKDFDLVFVGRLADQKNVDALLEALRPLNVRLLLIGGGNNQPEWQERYRDLGDRVCWVGKIPHPTLPAQLHRARAFILPSLYEGHPKALIEAMACGMPVIGGDAPGIRELIRHGDNGWLCGTTATEIRAAIQAVLGDEVRRERLGQSARATALDQFSFDGIFRMELALLEEVTREHSRRAAA